MLAQPGHPVFLDVLGRIIRDVAKDRSVSADYTKGQFKEEISKETLFNVVSSNCRYLPSDEDSHAA